MLLYKYADFRLLIDTIQICTLCANLGNIKKQRVGNFVFHPLIISEP